MDEKLTKQDQKQIDEYLQEHELSMKKEKDVQDYLQMFIKARDFDLKRFEDYRELMAFYEGHQNMLSQYAGEKPWVVDITTPYATDAINLRISSLLANEYLGELEPLSPEDIDFVDKLNYAYHSQWRELNMDKHISESILRASVLREAYTHIVYNPDIIKGGKNRKQKGQFEAYFIDPASIFIDPNALNFKEADYVCIVERISPRKVRDLYPNYNFLVNKVASVFSPTERGEIYIGNDFDSEQENILTRLTVYEMEDLGKKTQKVYRTVIVENQMVVPTKLMPTKFLPIAQLRWEKRMKSPYGLSLMDRLLPLQKSINSIESAITNTALAFAAPSFVLSKDSGLDPSDVAMTAGAPGMVYPVEGNIDSAIRPLFQDKVVDDQMITIKKENEDTIYKISGVSQQFLGDIGSAGNTSGGTDQAVQRAKIIEQKFLTNLEEYVEDLTDIIVDYVVKVRKGEVIYPRGEKRSDGSFEFTQVAIPEGIEDVEYTFNVNLDVKTPYSKERMKQLMLELYQFERQYDAPVKVVNVKDILKTYDMPNRQEFVERYEELVAKEDMKKSEIIAEFTKVAVQYQLPMEMVTQAINEVIVGKDTPTLDQALQQIEQLKQQQGALQEQQALQQQAMVNKQQLQQEKFMGDMKLQQQKMAQQQAMQQMQAPTQAPVGQSTGDETFSMGEQVTGGEEMTGDETFAM